MYLINIENNIEILLTFKIICKLVVLDPFQVETWMGNSKISPLWIFLFRLHFTHNPLLMIG